MPYPYWTWTDERGRRIGGAHNSERLAIEDARQTVADPPAAFDPQALYLVKIDAGGTRTHIRRIDAEVGLSPAAPCRRPSPSGE